MKRLILTNLLIVASFACNALSITTNPILFQGMDEVPLYSLCTPNAKDPKVEIFNEYLLECQIRIDEYAGEKIIKKEDIKFSNLGYSTASYDPATKKVTNIRLYMRKEAYSGVKELLEIKYGKARNEHGSSQWYGDEDGQSKIILSTTTTFSGYGEMTMLSIITGAMRRAQSEALENSVRETKSRRTKALKGL